MKGKKIVASFLALVLLLGTIYVVPANAATTAFDLTEATFSYNKHNSLSGSSAPSSVYLSITDFDDLSSIKDQQYQESTDDNESGVFLGDNKISTSKVQITSARLLKIPADSLPTTNSAGDKLVVKGTFIGISDNTYSITIPELEMVYDSDKNTWSVTKVSTDTETEEETETRILDLSGESFSIDETYNSVSETASQDNRKVLFLQGPITDKMTVSYFYDAVDDGTSGIYTGTTVDGVTKKTTAFKLNTNTGQYQVGKSSSAPLGAEEGMILIIKGDFYNSTDDLTVRMPELVFRYTNEKWVVYEEENILDLSGESFSIDETYNSVSETASQDNRKVLFLQGPVTDKMTVSYFYDAVDDGTSGIYTGTTVDGVTKKTTAFKLNTSDGQYQVGKSSSAPLDAEEGMILIIKGDFYNSTDDLTVRMPELVFKYTNGEWVRYTETKGDFNSDNKTDIRDLVRLKRHIIDSTVTITSDVTYNEDGEINFEDVDDLRWALVAGYSYDTTTGIALGTPAYSSNGVIERMAYSGPTVGTWTGTKYTSGSTFTYNDTTIIDADFQKYKNAGFTVVSSRGVADWYTADEDPTEEDLASGIFTTFMDAADRNGLKVVVNLRYIDVLCDQFLNNTTNFENNCVNKGGEAYSDELFNTWYQRVIYNRIINYLSTYPAFAGMIVGDEWEASTAELYKNIIDAIKAAETTLIQNGTITDNFILVTSQYPITVYDDGVGDKSGTEILTGSTNTVDSDEEAYQAYLEKFAEVNRMFTYDLYPLWYKLTEGGKCLNDDWFTNLELVANYAYKQGFTKTGVTIQSCAIAGSNEYMYQYAPTTEAQIGFQMYTALAYGMKSINYFCYNQSNDTSITDYITNNSEMYTAVKTVNDKVSLFDHVLVNYKWKGALDLAAGENGSGSAANSERLTIANVSDARTIIGCMKDKFGFDGYMLANAAEPNTTTDASVTLTFANADKAVVYVDGVPTTTELTDSSITITVPVGSGVFVIPVKSN